MKRGVVLGMVASAAMVSVAPRPAAAEVFPFFPEKVAECLASTERGEALPACIGDLRAVCPPADGYFSASGKVRHLEKCSAMVLALWEGLMDDQFIARRSALSPGGQTIPEYMDDQLIARRSALGASDGDPAQRADRAQEAWLAWREAECDAHPVLRLDWVSDCRVVLTARRAFDLRDETERLREGSR